MIQPTRFKHNVLPRFGRQIALRVVESRDGRLDLFRMASTLLFLVDQRHRLAVWRWSASTFTWRLVKGARARSVRVFHFPCQAWEGLFLAASPCSSIFIHRFTGEKHEACSFDWLGLMQDQGRLRRQPVLPWIEARSVLGVVSQTFLRDLRLVSSRPRIATASEPGRNTYQRYAP